ncbi:MAG: patatin-like phospholipase family protein [Thiobacillus sp.]|nr:patatin-like phospholipase family protein [Thiobacillus sp.]
MPASRHHSPASGRPSGKSRSRPRIGLALGSGSARGWAHVGVIRALEAAGIRPDLVCGTSIGALVGAACAAGELDRFEHWLLDLGMADVLAFMDVRLNGGLIKGDRLMEFFRRNFLDRPMEKLDLPLGVVATALHTGEEVWLREGSTIDAVRASIALPALFTPVVVEGRMLVDGGLVNPVPVSLARAMGADVVIAVDLNTDLLGRHLREPPERGETDEASAGEVSEWMRKLQENLSALMPGREEREERGPRLPSMLDVVASSINIMQVRISRSRMAGEPPDAIVAPKLARLGLLDFHKAREAMEEGRRAVAAALPGIREVLGD